MGLEEILDSNDGMIEYGKVSKHSYALEIGTVHCILMWSSVKIIHNPRVINLTMESNDHDWVKTWWWSHQMKEGSSSQLKKKTFPISQLTSIKEVKDNILNSKFEYRAENQRR